MNQSHSSCSLVSSLALALGVSLVSTAAVAEGGFYAGGSLGSAALQLDVFDPDIDSFEFDENDFAWKAYGGYLLNVGVLDLGVEGGYVDFGSPSTDRAGDPISLDTNGWNAFGTAGFELGPVGLFGKAGFVAWDIDSSSFGDAVDSVSEDGTDFAYGIGARMRFDSIEIRAEYEVYDLSGIEELDMISAGLVWHF